jgi:hypothetical protein
MSASACGSSTSTPSDPVSDAAWRARDSRAGARRSSLRTSSGSLRQACTGRRPMPSRPRSATRSLGAFARAFLAEHAIEVKPNTRDLNENLLEHHLAPARDRAQGARGPPPTRRGTPDHQADRPTTQDEREGRLLAVHPPPPPDRLTAPSHHRDPDRERHPQHRRHDRERHVVPCRGFYPAGANGFRVHPAPRCAITMTGFTTLPRSPSASRNGGGPRPSPRRSRGHQQPVVHPELPPILPRNTRNADSLGRNRVTTDLSPRLKTPALPGFSSRGRYWARTSDLLLVRSRLWIITVRRCASKPHIERLARPESRRTGSLCAASACSLL